MVNDTQKLIKCLGMLGSAHDGEVLNAARMAEGLRKAANVTWSVLVAGGERIPDLERELSDLRSQLVDAARAARGWAEIAARRQFRIDELESANSSYSRVALSSTIEPFIDKHAAVLSDWEKGFLRSVASQRSRGKSFSPKQRATIDSIAAKCGSRPPIT